MEFDFSIRHVKYEDRDDLLIKDSVGVVKCQKAFPIYNTENGEEIFKPLSKTKPLTTPLFGISEVFWSTVIHNYFDEKTPIYKLATCEGYEKDYPSRYSKGTLVPSVLKKREHLVNLLEYYQMHPECGVDIHDYINYCGVYYDYDFILNSLPFQKDDKLAQELAYQILISILKCDTNYHYENVAFIADGDEVVSLAPAIDHEFSIPFLYPDDFIMYSTYFSTYNMTLLNDHADESNINLSAILKNIRCIKDKYPKIADDFIMRLEQFIIDFAQTNFSLPKEYMEPFATNLYMVYEAIYKEHDSKTTLSEIPKFSLKRLDIDSFQEQIQRDIIVNASSFYKNLALK